MQRINILVSDEEHEVLRRLAFDQKTSVAKLVRAAIDQLYGTNDEEVQAPGRKAGKKE